MVVHEDWEGGAGNGLGSLYAFEKACAKAKTFETPVDVEKLLADKAASVVMFHTAGKGTRLAPLPGSENNNKPGVKLPSTLMFGEEKELLTILEAVVIQTSIYAKRAKGRLSVYWGDQVFVPTEAYDTAPTHHADILAQLGPKPTKEEWESKGFSGYGLIAVAEDGNATQVEKVTFEQAEKILSANPAKQVGVSLGSFSVSSEMLTALREEYRADLASKTGKFDTDPHWWMPLTQSEEDYVTLMTAKKVPEEDSKAHYARMGEFKKKFIAKGPGYEKVFGAVGIGMGYWWDYGQAAYYAKYNQFVTQDSVEAEAMRKFFRMDKRVCDATTAKKAAAAIDEASCVCSSEFKNGTVIKSVVANSNIGTVKVQDSILVNVTAPKVEGKGVVLYNVVSDKPLVFEDNEICADVYGDGEAKDADGKILEKITMRSTLDTHAGNEWKNKLAKNDYTFEEVYNRNASVDVMKAAAVQAADRAAVAAKNAAL